MPAIKSVTGPTKLCPECKVEGYKRKLRFLSGWRTDWYGVLRYYWCHMCRERFVTVNNNTPEVAA